jgi:RNA polymerase sigma-70 factor (ECF subfamily)
VLIDDSTDIGVLYSAYGGQLWRALLATSGGRAALAEDATAEAFTRLVAHRGLVSDPRAWLFRTGLRIVVAELRRERRASPQVDTGGPLGRASFLSPPLTSALQQLSPEQRLAVFLAYYADLPTREVARLSGTSTAAVKVRLHRARKTLRTLLEEEARV